MDNTQLKAFVDAMINHDNDASSTSLHDVVVNKVRTLLGEAKNPDASAEKLEDKAVDMLQKAQKMERKNHSKKAK